MNFELQLQLLAAELRRQAGDSIGGRFQQELGASPNASTAASTGSEHNDDQLFPYILHALLDDMEKAEHTGIISWSADGSAVQVTNQQLFESTILPAYFGAASTYSKFESQLKDWQFERIGHSIFLHPCFQKSRVSMCRFMRCRKQDGPSCTTIGGGNRSSSQVILSSQAVPFTVVVSRSPTIVFPLLVSLVAAN